MHKEKNDCDCKSHHHRHHHHHRHGYSTILKKTSGDLKIPQELLEVAEIKDGDFIEIRVRRVLTPSERKKHYEKHHSTE